MRIKRLYIALYIERGILFKRVLLAFQWGYSIDGAKIHFIPITPRLHERPTKGHLP